jgi:hypothetical protein
LGRGDFKSIISGYFLGRDYDVGITVYFLAAGAFS